MLARKLTRVFEMSRPEIAWRAATSARVAVDRVAARIVKPRWHRRALARALSADPALRQVRAALARERWLDAHRALQAHIVHHSPPRFLIAPQLRPSVARRVGTEFPDAARHAAAQSARLLRGDYDLLGYKGLRFGDDPYAPEWHSDPVYDRRAPARFWATVPYLDAACGDHKIIWELNRHQYWVQLGRAYWLTGDTRCRDMFVRQLGNWLRSNRPLTGVNWASMLELGFRSVSWLWALNFFADDTFDDRTAWTVDLLVGLNRQLGHIERNVSYYFSPNTHLLGEALALYVTGQALPLLAASGRRAALGRRILLAEIDRQIEDDGGHCERSTHYHRYALDFYIMALAAARITRDPAAPMFARAVDRLAFVARLLADDRGRLPRIGDDDGGALFPLCGRPTDDVRDSLAAAAALVERQDLRIGRAPEEPFWLLAHPQLADALDASRFAPRSVLIGSASLPATGYYVSRSAAGDHLVIDGGPHGFRNGGHSHADALSLTLSLHGIPLLIDPGTGCYTANVELRDRLRSTPLHNTVVVDGRSQSIPGGPFHWKQTAAATVHRWRTNGSFDYFEGVHDGYHPTEHRRHVLALHGDLVVVADLVNGGRDHTAAAHWHVDPRWRLDIQGRIAALTTEGAQAELAAAYGQMERFSGDEAAGLGWHAPEYGRVEPATTLRVTCEGAAPMWIVTAIGLNPENPIQSVEHVPLWAEAGVLGPSAAVRVTRAASVDYVLVAHPVDSADPTWRVAEFETDAHLMFCRVDGNRRLTRIALVDGSRMRTTGRRRVQVALPRLVTDLHVDLGTGGAEPIRIAEARVSGPGFGARVFVGGRELPLAVERRSAPRSSVTTG
jgi:hypothetical protein